MMLYDIDASAMTVISAILTRLLAGQMLAIAIANHAARSLPERSLTLRFQAENKLFNKTMPASLLLPLFGLIGSAIPTVSWLSGGFRSLPTTIFGFLIQVKPATDANSNSNARMVQCGKSVVIRAGSDIPLTPRVGPAR
jgi:hypothetical protein